MDNINTLRSYVNHKFMQEAIDFLEKVEWENVERGAALRISDDPLDRKDGEDADYTASEARVHQSFLIYLRNMSRDIDNAEYWRNEMHRRRSLAGGGHGCDIIAEDG
jgi:hypothetical protein